jgi:hypothetical protein
MEKMHSDAYATHTEPPSPPMPCNKDAAKDTCDVQDAGMDSCTNNKTTTQAPEQEPEGYIEELFEPTLNTMYADAFTIDGLPHDQSQSTAPLRGGGGTQHYLQKQLFPHCGLMSPAAYYGMTDDIAGHHLQEIQAVTEANRAIHTNPQHRRHCQQLLESLPDLPLQCPELISNNVTNNLQPDNCYQHSLKHLFPNNQTLHDQQQNGQISILHSTPDGDCLYNSIQIALFGTEKGCHALRLRTYLQLVIHYPHYFATAQQGEHRLLHLDAQGRNNNIQIAEMHRTLSDTVKIKGWSGIWQVAAIADIINRPIQLYYPSVLGGMQLFTSSMQPAREEARTLPPIVLFWCQAYGTFTAKTAARINANHFVPVLRTNTALSLRLPTPPLFSKHNLADPLYASHTLQDIAVLTAGASQTPVDTVQNKSRNEAVV